MAKQKIEAWTANGLRESTPKDNATSKETRVEYGRPRMSQRVRDTEPAHIERVLSRYDRLKPPPLNLAQGVAHWNPPPNALRAMEQQHGVEPRLNDVSNHRYGPVLGLQELREALTRKLEEDNGLDMTGQEVMVTAGGNQAFAMVALALLDPGDKVVLVPPFYCAHQCAIQLAGGKLAESEWDPATLLPNVAQLEDTLSEGAKMIVITTPGNPTGAVFPQKMVEDVAVLCGQHGAWLVVDEAYEHFVFEGTRHYSPCGNRLGCPNNVIHLFTMSKSFGLAGWRVGYAVYPAWISENMIKVQDTLPTHACTASQRIALAALEDGGCDWARRKVASLTRSRAAMWSAVEGMGGFRGMGAFYFLVPVPTDEDRAIDALARRWGVLTTPGRAFGAPGHVRVSYGSLPEKDCLVAARRLREGLQALVLEAKEESVAIDERRSSS